MMRELDAASLPLTGQHLVEASAGTGKTFNISLLYVRLLLEAGHALGSIAVVTFTDASMRDLRARLRKQLVEALQRLQGGPGEKKDALDRILSPHRVDAGTRQLALDRLGSAVLGFDEAQVWTLHGLCSRLLADFAFETAQPFAEIEAAASGDAILELLRDYWRRHMVETPDVAFAAVLERWKDPERLAGFMIRSQLLVTDPQCIDPLDPEALALDAQQRLDSALDNWRQHVQAGNVVEAKAALEALLAKRSLSVDKKKSWHHERAMAALHAAWQAPEVAECPDIEALRPLSAQAIEDDRNQKLRDSDWKPDGALAEVAECVDRLVRATADLEAARVALFVRRGIVFVQAGLRARQSRLRVHGYDDLIGKLHALLHGDDGARIAGQIAARLPAILVDEFQDTDALQYGILHRIHGARDDHGLFLIGDPKQAIYRFRGGDIFTYRKASEDAGDRRTTLLGNWRSDTRLIKAVNALFGGVDDAFLYPFIGFQEAVFPPQRTVSPAEHKGSAPMTVWRVADRHNDKGKVTAWTIRQISARVLAEVCAEIKGILRQTAQASEPPSIAVLVNTNRQAEDAARALAQWNVPFDYVSAASIYASDEAGELETVIAAICAPGDAAAVRAGLATGLLGEDLASLLAARDDLERWEAQLGRISRLRKLWLERGPFAMLAACVQEAAPRLLTLWNGRRQLTNFLHLAELVERASLRRSSAEELLRWLAERRSEAVAKRGEGHAEQIRAADAGSPVQVLTIHRSKGLQYDHVFAPFLFSTRWQSLKESMLPNEAASWHEGTQARIDIGGPQWYEHALLHREEQFAESLRLAYVALTRARHRVWFAWAYANTGLGGDTSLVSALAWLCLRDGELSDPADLSTLAPESADEALQDLAQRADGSIAIATLEVEAPAVDAAAIQRPSSSLAAIPFGGNIDRHFGVWSYSRLFVGNAHAPVADHDEVAAAPVVVAAPIEDPVPQWPRGAGFGDCVHAVFEEVPFAQLAMASPPESLARICENHGYLEADQAIVADMVRAAVSTELLPDTGLSLAVLERGDALAELEFLFPLDGADLGRFEDILHSESRYARQAGELRARRASVAGLMTGFIDLVLRWQDRYYVLDYKTNLLGPSRSDYAPNLLPDAIRAHDYDLQYLVYLVALQRFLRSRLGDAYDYERHIGGALYLFVRGMRKGNAAGIHHDRPPAALIDALDAWCGGARP